MTMKMMMMTMMVTMMMMMMTMSADGACTYLFLYLNTRPSIDCNMKLTQRPQPCRSPQTPLRAFRVAGLAVLAARRLRLGPALRDAAGDGPRYHDIHSSVVPLPASNWLASLRPSSNESTAADISASLTSGSSFLSAIIAEGSLRADASGISAQLNQGIETGTSPAEIVAAICAANGEATTGELPGISNVVGASLLGRLCGDRDAADEGSDREHDGGVVDGALTRGGCVRRSGMRAHSAGSQFEVDTSSIAGGFLQGVTALQSALDLEGRQREKAEAKVELQREQIVGLQQLEQANDAALQELQRDNDKLREVCKKKTEVAKNAQRLSRADSAENDRQFILQSYMFSDCPATVTCLTTR